MKMDPPASGGGTTRLRVVIVTLDNHLSGAFERAAATLARDGISVGFHAAADWEGNPQAVDACRADIARGDIIIATMLFLDDHIRAVLPALKARRDQCDAMVGLMSGAEIVRLTRLGGYRMDAPATGPMALLKRLRGSAKADSGAGQMRMLRRLPRLLRFIPGTAQDVRAYFLTLQYWLAGSDDNAAEMVRALVARYAAGPREGLRETVKARPPVEYPEVGVYHPRLKARLSADVRDLPAAEGKAGTVGLLLLRSYLLGRDTAHYDGVIAALEARGLKVIPAFASGLDARPAIERFFVKPDGRPAIDALVSLTGFSLVGGPAYNDSAAAEELLAGLDIPYVAAHPLEFQTLQQWGRGTQGLLPLEATMMVALPELDGAQAPIVFGGRADPAGGACEGCDRGCRFEPTGLAREMQACAERAGALAGRVAGLVALRRTPRALRRLAVVLFNFPPNAGSAGSAAFLSVFESLHNTLTKLGKEGWTVDGLPADAEGLKEALLGGNSARYGAEANVARRVPADEIVSREPHLKEIEAQWGPAPGRVNADSGHAHVMGAQFGNIFVGLQPAIGIEGDPMRLMFEGRFAPTHAMSAFYRHIREDFAAHAVLHFGTHGALEFLPGKQAGLSARCWPDRLMGAVPHVYLYASNNPSEGILAKRRTGATLVSYLTPPLAEAGLAGGLSELRATLERWRRAPEAERATLAAALAAQAEAADLDGNDPDALAAKLYELERERIPQGLHVVGEGLSGEALRTTLEALPEGDRTRAAELLSRDHELAALVHALDAGYIRPAPGGDLARNPDVLPTGRNLHGFDPFAIPAAHALEEGAAQADRLLARHRADTGQLPRSVAMVLWGTDNMKSGGAQLAQALALMGARPRRDSYGRLCGAELIPLSELGRPRIDVVATLSGIFRDLLPLQTRMLAEAAWLASVADEPAERNFVRANSLAHQARHGVDLETAALRVFSNAEGAYGANVNLMIDSGCWTDPDELAEAFERQKGYAYGVKGPPVRQGEMMASALSLCELAYQNLESIELGVTTIDQYVDTLGGVSRMIRKGRGEAAPVYIGDETQGAAKVRRLEEQVALEIRTRMLNPAWYEPMLRHGGEGVHQIEAGVTATMGWSATTGEVSPWVYQRISETFVLDPEMRERLQRLNPKACARVANRLIEASERRFWSPDAATLEALQKAADAIEDALEGVSTRAA